MAGLLAGLWLPLAVPAQSLTPQVTQPRASIVVFAAFSCAYCAQAAQTLAALQRRYPDTLAVQFKHFPLSADAEDVLAHEAALAAAAQGKFPALHEALFRQPRRALDRAALDQLAEQAGLDMARYRRDLDGHVWRGRVEDDRREAAAFGVRATPTFFVQGFKLEGLQDASVFETLIEQARTRGGSGAAPSTLQEASHARR
ncbi:MAG: DsbA family protein [Rhodanobacteraceae bacterium]|nr:DsbA family protein [Rhodanobacteraceae bacterium]